MKNLKPALIYIVFSLLVFSCAAPYKNIAFKEKSYIYQAKLGNTTFDLAPNVMTNSGNYKQANKELRNNFRVFAVKITNNSTDVVDMKKIGFTSSAIPVDILDHKSSYKKLKQRIPFYLLYNLLIVDVIFGSGDSKLIPVGTPLSMANIALALQANHKLKKELYEYDITERKIQAGETVYGLIVFKDYHGNPIRTYIK